MRLATSNADGLQNATLVFVSIAGLLAFFLPFLISALPNAANEVSSRTVEASLLLALIVGGSLIVTVAELVRGPGTGNHARSVALLAALVTIDATLRLVPSFGSLSNLCAHRARGLCLRAPLWLRDGHPHADALSCHHGQGSVRGFPFRCSARGGSAWSQVGCRDGRRLVPNC